jgi:ferric-dicitrate binding protein FerR (iron transport regulator)
VSDPAEIHDPQREDLRQFDHEHCRAYEAVERAAQRLELAGPGHTREAGLLRAIRRRLARHVNDGSCDGD